MMSPSRLQPPPVGDELRFGNDGLAVEIPEVAGGNELIKVLEAQLVLGQEDDVLGAALGLVASRTQLEHQVVDLLEALNAMLTAHFFKKRNEHIAHHGGIVAGPAPRC